MLLLLTCFQEHIYENWATVESSFIQRRAAVSVREIDVCSSLDQNLKKSMDRTSQDISTHISIREDVTEVMTLSLDGIPKEIHVITLMPHKIMTLS